jgi:hypothetical protein
MACSVVCAALIHALVALVGEGRHAGARHRSVLDACNIIREELGLPSVDLHGNPAKLAVSTNA